MLPDLWQMITKLVIYLILFCSTYYWNYLYRYDTSFFLSFFFSFFKWKYLVILDKLAIVNKIIFDEIGQDILNTLFNSDFMSLNMNFGIFRCLIRCRDTSEFLDFTSLSLLVKTLGITLFNNIKRSISINFNERNTSSLMKSSSRITISSVRTDKSSDGNNSGVSK